MTAIATNAYDGTVDPLYSIVPPGFGGHIEAFQEKYGDPDVDKAKAAPRRRPASRRRSKITIGVHPDPLRPERGRRGQRVAAQLEDSGLFEVTMESAEWEQYQTIAKEGAYDLYLYGWFPDILDADNYLAPFIRSTAASSRTDTATKRSTTCRRPGAGETDPTAREAIFGQLQDIVAEDVPFIPVLGRQEHGGRGDEMAGVEETLDPTYIFRFWGISKTE